MYKIEPLPTLKKRQSYTEKNMETGEASSLLPNFKMLGSNYNKDDENQTNLLQSKPRNSRVPGIIYGFAILESTGSTGVAVNLAVYMRSVLHESNSATAAKLSVWQGTNFLLPVIGAFMADTYLGNYKTVFISCLLYIPGMVMVTISAIYTSSVFPVSEFNKLLFFFGLYLVSAGGGGVKSAMIPHAMEQFDEDEGQRKAEFFNRYYVSFSFGFLVSGTFIVWIQVNVSWALGFGLSTICMVLAVLLFLSGTPAYRIGKPGGSPLKSLLQVLVVSVKKMNLKPSTDDTLLYEVNDSEMLSRKHRLGHTNEFKFLDRAATKTSSDFSGKQYPNPWNLCTITQVEELKLLLRLLPIWATGIIFNLGYAQLSTTFIEQGSSMNTTVLSFSIPPATLSTLQVIFIMIWAFTFHHFNKRIGLSQLQRIGVGRLLMILTMATAAIVEARRLRIVKQGSNLSICWQIPYYILLGGAEVFANIGDLEFFYEQAPETMKSLCVAFTMLCVSLGSYLNSLLVVVVELLTTRGGGKGWLPDNLDGGHLDYFFGVLAVVSCVNFAGYVALAVKYTPKKVVLG